MSEKTIILTVNIMYSAIYIIILNTKYAHVLSSHQCSSLVLEEKLNERCDRIVMIVMIKVERF